MAQPWLTIATVATAEGTLELRRRGDDWLMTIGGRVLMNSFSRASEEQLARLAVAKVERPVRTALCAGLGMGFTLRALLDATPDTAKIMVAELNPVVVEWCRDPLAAATGGALRDRRVEVQLCDVADVIARAAPGSLDLILLDLYEGPNRSTQASNDPFYGPAALARAHRALAHNGVLAVWSEDADASFGRRFQAARFSVTKRAIGSGGRRHLVYIGHKQAPSVSR